MNEKRQPHGIMQNSVSVGGSAGNIQNVHGDGASAVMHDAAAAVDPLETLRTLLRQACLSSELTAGYERALAEVESARRTGPRGISGVRKTMEFLSSAASVISGWTEALEALRHTIPGL
jgi:hypothetical protein